MQNVRYTPLGCYQIAAPASAATLASLIPSTAKIPAGANMVLLQADTQNVRWTDDGVLAPTATVGMLLSSTANEPFQYTGNLNALQVVQAASGAKLNVAFYKVVG